MARLVEKTKELTKKAAGKADVTKAQVRRSARCKAPVKTIGRRFKEQKFSLHPYKEKILLSAEDKKERLAWGKKHDRKTPEDWKKKAQTRTDGARLSGQGQGKFGPD